MSPDGPGAQQMGRISNSSSALQPNLAMALRGLAPGVAPPPGIRIARKL